MSYYTLTQITVDGDEQECFEVYADETKSQTIGFVYDANRAVMLAKGLEMHAVLTDLWERYGKLWDLETSARVEAILDEE